MPEPLLGYWNIQQAIRICELAAEDARASRETSEGSPFGGADLGRPPADVLRRALESGGLLAAATAEHDGDLVTIQPRLWRVQFRREPLRRPRYTASDGFSVAPPPPDPPMLQPFAEAAAGRTIPRLKTEIDIGFHWITPLIAQADLARWMGEDPPAEPLERPADWPAPIPPRPSTLEQLEWFVLGYAVRAAENGKPATRDEVREAVLKENMGTAREADSAHAALPARLKNPDRSKGSNRPK